MLEPNLSLDVGDIGNRARSLWREASSRATSARVELYTKVSRRIRVSRDVVGTGVTIDRTQESGLAVRALTAGRDRAGFAATSGFSVDFVRWAVDTASKFDAQAPASAPDPSASIEAERWDLDAEAAPPDEAALTGGVIARPDLEWVEAGTTVEVLIGAEGWLTARRRHRIWALRAVPNATLFAQRGFDGWERHLDEAAGDVPFESIPKSNGMGVLVLAPEAASSVVAALVDTFHGPASIRLTSLGKGWEISDEPDRSDGLSGGSFDDAGFPAAPRILAARGAWVSGLSGAGTFRRASFRTPPTETASNLFMAPGVDDRLPPHAVVARRCSVLRLSKEVWVLGLDLANRLEPDRSAHSWLRVHPQALLAACASRLGGTRLTASGPSVPALVLEGILNG